MKLWKIAGIALLVVLAASLVTGFAALAQDQDPAAQTYPEGEGVETTPKFGRGWRGGGIGGGHFKRGGIMDDTFKETIAGALDMTAQELQAELDTGKRLHEIADERGVTEDELQEAMMAAYTAKIEQAVADGTLAQEQADPMLERMAQATELAEAQESLFAYQIEQAVAAGTLTQEQADLLLEHKHSGRGFGSKGFGGRMRGGGHMRGGRMGPGGCGGSDIVTPGETSDDI